MFSIQRIIAAARDGVGRWQSANWMQKTMAKVWVRAQGVDGDAEKFLARASLREVASFFGHDLSKPTMGVVDDEGHITNISLDQPLADLAHCHLTGDGSRDNPYVVCIQRAGANLSVASPEAKTVYVIFPAMWYGVDATYAVFTFDDEKSFKEYLEIEQCGGLIQLDGRVPAVGVCKFAQLVPNGVYARSLGSQEDLATALREIRHLQQAQEDGQTESFSQHGASIDEDEEDEVVMERPEPRAGPRVPWHPGPRAEPRGPNSCKALNVVRFQRSGHATQGVKRMGAAGRLLRF